jgi:hypothetical protein
MRGNRRLFVALVTLNVLFAVGIVTVQRARSQVGGGAVLTRANPILFAHPDVIRPVVHGASISLAETIAAPTGALNTARIYARDNGSGKSQLVVQFATGAVQVIATEP